MLTVLYHAPNLNTVYAGRTIFQGYKNAFLDLGYKFEFLTADQKFDATLEQTSPDIFITSLNRFYLRFIDREKLKEKQKNGLKVFVNIPFWKSPISKTRVNESPGLSEDSTLLNLIVKEHIGDYYYNVCEPGDPRMDGFEKLTGQKYHTIPLAADKATIFKGEYREKFSADISYIGTNLSQKRAYFNEILFPLAKKYQLKLYGQDWYFKDKLLGWTQRAGQYFNIPILKDIQKPQLKLEDEPCIYKSSVVSVNIHEDYQRKFGGDCNERTFKIPLAGGFEITDDVACIRKYFKDGEEIIIAKDRNDWFDKIDYYIKNPEKRLRVIEAGRTRVLAEHTYHNRVQKIIDIYNTLK